MQSLLLSLLIFTVTTNIRSLVVDGFSNPTGKNSVIEYRKGKKGDEVKIASTLAKELMNPLGIQSDRFVVATSLSSSFDVPIGWAQIKPLGTTAQADPTRFDARPGSYNMEQDIDDQMWEEFDNDDNIKVPVGLASLPWTKEYRAMEKGVQDRAKRREQFRQERLQEMQQQREPQTQQLYELSSVFVEKEFRGQGIGTELVRRVLRQHSGNGSGNNNNNPTTNVYLLTLSTTVDWYKDNFGFEEVSGTDIPSSMSLEVTAGNIITKLIGAQLCCMKGTSKTLELCK